MKHTFIKSAFLVMAALMLLRGLGFVREMSLAAVYGAGMVTDAFVIAFTSPGAVLAFISTSMAVVYIPVYHSSTGDKNRFSSNIITLMAIVGMAFSLIFTAFPQALVFIFASRLDAETFSLAVMMTRIMVWSAVPMLLMSILRGYLEIKGAFFVAQATYASVNICIILAIFISRRAQYLPLLGLGMVFGIVICIAAMIISSRKYGLIYRPHININDSSIKEMLVLALPVIIGVGISEINQIVDRNFASSLTTGSISALNYAAKVFGLAVTLVGTATATVLFPKMSQLAAGSDFESLKRYLLSCLKILIPILLPLTAGTAILAEPITGILFERGMFNQADTVRTAECLRMYSVCIFFSSINALLLRACHSMKNTKGPAVCSAIAVTVNIASNFALIGPLAHSGLALSTGIASMVMTFSLIIVLRQSLGQLGLRREAVEFLKAIAATLLMSAAVLAGMRYLPVMSAGTWQCVALTAGLVIFGIGIYSLSHMALRSSFLADSLSLTRDIRKAKPQNLK